MMDCSDNSVASSVPPNNGSIGGSLVSVDVDICNPSTEDSNSTQNTPIYASSNMEVTGHQVSQMRQALQNGQRRKSSASNAPSSASIYSNHSIMSHDSSDSGSYNEEQSLYEIDLDGTYSKKKVKIRRRKPKTWEQARALRRTRRLFRLALLSNCLFVLGSVLFVWVSLTDLRVAQLAQNLPAELKSANDDAAWNQWYWQQELHKKLTGSSNGIDAAGHTRRQLQILVKAAKSTTTTAQQSENEDNNADWNDALWKDLPQEFQQALTTLGHDEQTWNEQATSEIEKLPWASLTAEQKAAAVLLGYNADTWDAVEQNEETDAEEEAASTPTDWTTDDSAKVATMVQNVLAGEYGSTTETVANSNSDSTLGNTTSATTTGTLNEFKGAEGGEPFEVENPLYQNASNYHQLMVWGNVSWAEMPSDIKAAFQILGYTGDLWESGGTAYTEDLYWQELTADQQKAALFLGYSQALWDQGQQDDVDSSAGTDATPGWDAPTAALSDEPIPQDEETPATPGAPGGEEIKNNDDDQSASMPPTQPPTTVGTADPEFNYRADELILSVMGVDIYQKQMIYLAAALCFMVVGLIDWIRDSLIFHVWMVLGGLFGVLSAIFLEASELGSLILQTLSVHCFLLESLFMLRLRKTLRPVDGLKVLSNALWIADICFGIGSALKVVMTYWLHFDDEAKYDINVTSAGVLASGLWMVCAFVYMTSTVILTRKTDSLITGTPGGIAANSDPERVVD